MKKKFLLERFFALHEFKTKYIISCSDCEQVTISDLKKMLKSEANEKKRTQNLDLIDKFENLPLGYTESQGHPELRKMIAKSFYSTVKDEEILVGVPEELIYIAMNCLLKKGDEVITTFPSYQSLYSIAEEKKCNVVKWKLNLKTLKFDVDQLLKLVSDKTKMIVFNFPHNPSGALLTRKEMDIIIKIAKEKSIILFSDEIYRYLDVSVQSLPSVSDLYDNSLSLFGMSKSFGLAGLRVGWLVVRNKEWMEDFMSFKEFTTICSSAPSEVLSMMGIRLHLKLFERSIKIIRKNVKLAEPFFEKYKTVITKYTLPRCGSIGMIEMKGLSSKMTSKELSEMIVEKKNLMLLPFDVFELSESMFRIGYGRKNFEKCLQLLGDFIDEHYGKEMKQGDKK